MLQTPCYIVGDAHLGIAPSEAERSLLHFLTHVKENARSLVIMGDLFDFWFSWKHVMPRAGFRVLAALADIRDKGIDILWIGGNHDCWGGEALEELTGATYTLTDWAGSVGAWKVHLAHGDGLREKEDAPYRRLRYVLRHPLAIRAYGWLHPDHASAIALKSSKTSRHRMANDEGRGLMRVAQAQLLADNSLNLVVHGHSHVPTLQQAGSGWYANAGAWYLDKQYLLLKDDVLERRCWDESSEGHLLNAAHRISQESSSDF